MSLFRLHCRACTRPLSTPLFEISTTTAPLDSRIGQDALPPGSFWRAGVGVDLPAVRPGDLVCVRADLDIQPCGTRNGCCGPDGLDGPNLACACGTTLGTELGDCWQAHYVALTAVYAAPDDGSGRRVLTWDGGRGATIWELAAWLHEALVASDWSGEDLEAVAAQRVDAPLLVFSKAGEAHASGVPIQGWIARLRAAGLDILAL